MTGDLPRACQCSTIVSHRPSSARGTSACSEMAFELNLTIIFHPPSTDVFSDAPNGHTAARAPPVRGRGAAPARLRRAPQARPHGDASAYADREHMRSIVRGDADAEQARGAAAMGAPQP